MTQAFTPTPLDAVVTAAVQEGLEAASTLEQHVADVLDECLALAGKLATRHGEQAGSEALAGLQTALRASRADATTPFMNSRTPA